MLKDVIKALLSAKGKFDFDDVVEDYENGSFFVKLWRESENIWVDYQADDAAERLLIGWSSQAIDIWSLMLNLLLLCFL